MREERVDPSSAMYFRFEDRKGGPTANIHDFESAYNIIYQTNKKYGGYEKHPLYGELYKLHSKNVTTLNYANEHQGILEFGIPPPGMAPAICKKMEPAPPTTPVPELPPNLEANGNGVADPNKAAPVVPAQPAAPAESAPAATLTQEDAKTKTEAEIKPVNIPEATPAPANPAPVNQVNPASAQQAVAMPKQTTETPVSSEKKGEPGTEKLDEETILKKKQKKCDEVFAEYLDSIAKYVNKESYRQVLKFVFLFRECLNHYGERLMKAKQVSSIPPSLLNGKLEEPKVEEYCIANNADQAPEVSNEFVTIYLDELKVNFGSFDSVELTQNFCNWLFVNSYTCSKLSLIQDNPQ